MSNSSLPLAVSRISNRRISIANPSRCIREAASGGRWQPDNLFAAGPAGS
jgi:hypothetical protein